MKIKFIINSYTIFILVILLSFTVSCNDDEIDSIIEVVYGSVTDQENNTYKTVTIGTQTWMAENLKTTIYRNGDFIETTSPKSLDLGLADSPKYQWAFDSI